MTKKQKKEYEDQYEEFLIEIPILLGDLQSALEQSKKYQNVILENWDDDTIQKVENFYIDILKGREKKIYSELRFQRILIAYLGEMILNRKGGKWAMHTAKGSSYYGSPVIVNWSDKIDSVIPIILVQDTQFFIKEKKVAYFKARLATLFDTEKELLDFRTEFGDC